MIGTEFEHGPLVLFSLKGDLTLTFYPRKDSAWYAKVSLDERGSTEFSIGHTVSTKEEVDEVVRQAASARAKVVRQAQPAFWEGYSRYFKGPDGNLWDVLWNQRCERRSRIDHV